jgi:hypothetical protein
MLFYFHLIRRVSGWLCDLNGRTRRPLYSAISLSACSSLWLPVRDAGSAVHRGGRVIVYAGAIMVWWFL